MEYFAVHPNSSGGRVGRCFIEPSPALCEVGGIGDFCLIHPFEFTAVMELRD